MVVNMSKQVEYCFNAKDELLHELCYLLQESVNT